MEFMEKMDTFNKQDNDKLRLNVGCGVTNLPGYVNLDMIHDTADIKEDFFIYGRTCGSIYDEVLMSHFIEHVPIQKVQECLGIVMGCLKPGGKISIVAPDFDYIADCWIRYRDDWRRLELNHFIFGGQSNQGDFHVSAWNNKILAKQLLDAGFENVWTVLGWDHNQRTVLGGGDKPKEDKNV
jgi:hypothetical protein